MLMDAPAGARNNPLAVAPSTMTPGLVYGPVSAGKITSGRKFAKLLPLAANWPIVALAFLSVAVPQLALLWRPAVGAYATAMMLLALMTLALRKERLRKLALAAAVYPLSLFIAMTLPITGTFDRAAAFYDVLLLFSIAYSLIFALTPPYEKTLSRKTYLLWLPIMVVVGEALGGLGYALLRHHYEFTGTVVPLVVGAGVFAIAEELFFRGLLQRQAAKVMHPAAATAAASLAYAAAAIGHGTWLPAAFALLSGAALSTIFYFKPSVLLTTIANMTMKLTYFGLMWTFVLK